MTVAPITPPARRTGSRLLATALGALLTLGLTTGAQAASDAPAMEAEPYLTRPIMDDVMYFVMPDRFNNADPSNDRGGLTGTRMEHGFDPTDKAYYHGGDIQGLIDKLDYIAGLGVTAIWFTPIYKNKPVQPHPGGASSGYHGYWITDFTETDPHLGSRADLKRLVDEAHARNIKVILDIITNHTADVIKYRQCHDPDYQGPDKEGPYGACVYRDKASYPYSTRGGVDGPRINEGFKGDRAPFQTAENFAKLKDMTYAYEPFVPEAEIGIKKPAWLNDLRYYHNRGETTFTGENSLYGDFAGLDDLFTAHPDVVQGFIDIYKSWISEFRIDGFRIDTARHVNPEFWQAFVPAMLEHARQEGIPNFYIFGEVYNPDPAYLARFTHVDEFPTVLDFAFQDTVTNVIARGKPTRDLTDLFLADASYKGGWETARRLPVFLGNHDMGRFTTFLKEANPDISDAEALKRTILAHAVMFFTRGVPVIYYGDEQGFVADGNDQDARENMFPSQVAIYNDNDLIGTDATTATDNFDTGHPLYRAISDMARALHAHATLRRGEQILRFDEGEAGLFALSRLDPETGEEFVFAFNSSGEAIDRHVQVETESVTWSTVMGTCAQRASAPGSLRVRLPAYGFAVCRSVR